MTEYGPKWDAYLRKLMNASNRSPGYAIGMQVWKRRYRDHEIRDYLAEAMVEAKVYNNSERLKVAERLWELMEADPS